ncbi:LysR family transcriptional regulator [Serratia proteamaculans]|uniref:LysR family transcriptional regulator n=2 Tax=Serratia proteamaculans TaxID=28151 RepID=UPI001C593296|nr:LysR family transcriptional regulator [Serratia proteamaculans]WEO90891.1 LysR family transcriptional regulator [Serratia proteamaculans]
METLMNLESFLRSAELGSFTLAARQLGVSPAAVSRNVAQLERNLGVKLFQRSTRQLTLTEVGRRFLLDTETHVRALRTSILNASMLMVQPTGSVRISVAPTFGQMYLLPTILGFRTKYPDIQIVCDFDDRKIDLIAEEYDLAIGGGFGLMPSHVSQQVGPLHIVAVSSKEYLGQGPLPGKPTDLANYDGIAIRSKSSGRIRQWAMRTTDSEELLTHVNPSLVVNSPTAAREAALNHLGVALLALPDVLPYLESGQLIRLLPDWYSDAGAISLYYANRTLLPRATRLLIDYLHHSFVEQGIAKRFQA